MNILLYLCLLGLNFASSSAEIFQLDTVVVQLRSSSDTDSSVLLDKVLRISQRYLNDYFTAYYASKESDDYFDKVEIDASSFGIQGFDGSYISTIELDGQLLFNDDLKPSAPFINGLMMNAFQGLNLDLYLENFLVSDDPFLSGLTHMIIEVNELLVTEKNFQDSSDGDSITESNTEVWTMEDWTEIAIYAGVGLAGAIILLAICCFCRCCCSRKRKVQVEPDVIKVKSIEIPTPVETNHYNTRFDSYRDTKEIKRQSHRRQRPPSPDRSLESSLYTYTPTDVPRDIANINLGSVSYINGEVPNFDTDRWQRQNIISPITPAPFGNDISAIEQRDQLSLIEEGDEEFLPTRDRKRKNAKKNNSSLALRNSRYSRSRNHQPARSSRRTSKPTVIDYSTEEMDSSSSDVIHDLKNLSLQIDRHRKSRAGRY